MRALLVEDDATTAASIKMMLSQENFICDTTDLDEYEVLRRLRAARVPTPILILSGVSELDDKIKALGFGADDFLIKPFERRELIARIQAKVRRSKGHSESMIRTGKFVVNLDTRVVTVDDQPLHLTGKEYGVLELLSLRKGTTLTKEMFLNHLYGAEDEPEVRLIDTFVYHLRKKLAEATGGDHYIETEWGRGYVLRDPGAAPQPKLKWTPKRKADVVKDVECGKKTIEDTLRQYQLSYEEFMAWKRDLDTHGQPGLRTTRVQQYRSKPRPRRR